MKNKKLPEKINILDTRPTNEISYAKDVKKIAEKINAILDFLSEEVEGEECCPKCKAKATNYLVCINTACECHTPQKPSWEEELENIVFSPNIITIEGEIYSKIERLKSFISKLLKEERK